MPTGYRPYPNTSSGSLASACAQPLGRSRSFNRRASPFATAPSTPTQLAQPVAPLDIPGMGSTSYRSVSHLGAPDDRPGTPILSRHTTPLPLTPNNIWLEHAPLADHFGLDDDTAMRTCPDEAESDKDMDVPGVAPPEAPTILELELHKVKLIKRLKACHKYQEKAGAALVTKKNVPAKGTFSERDQSFMNVMKAHLYWNYAAQAPFAQAISDLVQQATEYANSVTNWPGDEIVTVNFRKTFVNSRFSVRGTGQAMIRSLVSVSLEVGEGDETAADAMLDRDRFLYPNSHKRRHEMFKVPLLGKAIAKLLFERTRQVGVLFIDKLLGEDTPEELDTLLNLAGIPQLSGTNSTPDIVDPSPDAMRGPSLGLIAFACIHICHALEQLKEPNKRIDFGEGRYDDLWAHYVRELAAHPHLGLLRSSILDSIKEEYCLQYRRQGAPLGSDYAW
ncbi:hypothetical protein BDV93DRAFT_200817 [Ceratobasidium sp. AG-I]|nr:hypothetical protein BDV93DRAFT_200817 [Ceratobasidium sp. AG-I]